MRKRVKVRIIHDEANGFFDRGRERAAGGSEPGVAVLRLRSRCGAAYSFPKCLPMGKPMVAPINKSEGKCFFPEKRRPLSMTAAE